MTVVVFTVEDSTCRRLRAGQQQGHLPCSLCTREAVGSEAYTEGCQAVPCGMGRCPWLVTFQSMFDQIGIFLTLNHPGIPRNYIY